MLRAENSHGHPLFYKVGSEDLSPIHGDHAHFCALPLETGKTNRSSFFPMVSLLLMCQVKG
jgi:hypothetical protein